MEAAPVPTLILLLIALGLPASNAYGPQPQNDAKKITVVGVQSKSATIKQRYATEKLCSRGIGMKPVNSGNPDWHESDFLHLAMPVRERKSKLKMALLWIFIAGVAGVYLICEVIIVSLFLSFEPDWADGWPGLSSQTVISTVIAFCAALILMTAAGGAGAIAGLIGALAGVRPESQFRFYCRWLCIAAVAIVCLSIFIFNYGTLASSER